MEAQEARRSNRLRQMSLLVFCFFFGFSSCFAPDAKQPSADSQTEHKPDARAAPTTDPVAEYVTAQRAAYQHAVSEIVWLLCLPLVVLGLVCFRLCYTSHTFTAHRNSLDDVKTMRERAREKHGIPDGRAEPTREEL
jgi:hypothetical protein